VVEDGSGPSELHTGTSVASAVTSAAAAVVWSYRPALSAAEVMEQVFAGGADLGRPVDVCAGRRCGRTAHRVSLCGALQAACRSGAGGCPASGFACTRRPAGRDAHPQRVSLASLGLPPPASAKSLAPVSPVGWPCSGHLNATPGASVSDPCPASQYPAPPLAAVVSTQSDRPMCPHCAYSPTGMELYIEIRDDFTGTLTNPVFRVVVDSSAGDIQYFDLSSSVPVLYGGDQTIVDDLDIGSSTFESATIEFVVDGSYSDVSPVMNWD